MLVRFIIDTSMCSSSQSQGQITDHYYPWQSVSLSPGAGGWVFRDLVKYSWSVWEKQQISTRPRYHLIIKVKTFSKIWSSSQALKWDTLQWLQSEGLKIYFNAIVSLVSVLKNYHVGFKGSSKYRCQIFLHFAFKWNKMNSLSLIVRPTSKPPKISTFQKLAYNTCSRWGIAWRLDIHYSCTTFSVLTKGLRLTKCRLPLIPLKVVKVFNF